MYFVIFIYMEMKHQLYKITNKTNGKYYIGVHTGNIFEDVYWGSGTLISQAIEKYGIDNFDREIIAEFNNKMDLFKAESEIVNEEFINNPITYNLAVGGTGGNLGTIVNKKISEQMKGENHMYYGKKRPEHTKWLNENHPMKGKSHSVESLKKMRNNHPNTKKVLQYTKNGDFVKEWNSANEAVKELKIGHIHQSAQEIRKSAGGFVWKYKK